MTGRRFLASCFIVFLAMSALPASAHVLLPKELVEYVREHPDATPEEIQAFVDQNPDLKEADNQRQQDLVELVRTQGEPNFFEFVLAFLVLGIEHILSGPDHILFVFSLLLTFVTLRRTAWLLSCFTLSHSVTIILAGLGILHVSSAFVEPFIALSIAYVAVTSVFLAPRYPFFADNRAKALTVLAFGFFHGMGFAGALEQVELPRGIWMFLSSLLAFNLGVDIGQLLIVGVALPFLLLFRKTNVYKPSIQVMAVVISILALGWFVQRVLYPA